MIHKLDNFELNDCIDVFYLSIDDDLNSYCSGFIYSPILNLMSDYQDAVISSIVDYLNNMKPIE